jgi:hypothetical protein
MLLISPDLYLKTGPLSEKRRYRFPPPILRHCHKANINPSSNRHESSAFLSQPPFIEIETTRKLGENDGVEVNSKPLQKFIASVVVLQ